MDTADKEIQFHLDMAFKVAEQEIEKRARKILVKHPFLDEFIMAMGYATFTEKGKNNSRNLSDFKYMKSFEEFIDKWDDKLRLTGIPMRFTANGPKVTEW